ncbi:MAG: tRNA (adenosine(37)-N6)-threonylcarbamoyltransferase complex dimerization subunit type 1 TsaB [Halothiobacillaceae bacterium]
MRLLALETATEGCSAALSIDGAVSARFELAPRRHTQLLLPMVEELLAEADMTVSGLDAIAFGRGPGSFTGVRIAAAVAQGLAFGADLPLVPVSTLAALAAGALPEGRAGTVLALIDARMDEVYAGLFSVETSGRLNPVWPERVCPPAEVPSPLAADWIATGSGWDRYGAGIIDRLSVPPARVEAGALPLAASTVRLAAFEFAQGGGLAPEDALPVYLRDQVATPPAMPGR